MIFRPQVWERHYIAPRDPISIALIGLTVVGGLSSAGAQLSQGKTAQTFANYNSQILNSRANQVEAESRAKADIQRRENARRLGKMAAAYGAAGVDMEGSPLDVMSDQATENELQVQLILYGGQTQGDYLRQQGTLAKMGGQAAMSAAETAAGTTLLTTATSAGFMGYKASGTGGGGTGMTLPTGAQSGVHF